MGVTGRWMSIMGSVYTYTCKDLSDLVAFSFLASEPFMLPAGDACSWGGKRRFPIILLSPPTSVRPAPIRLRLRPLLPKLALVFPSWSMIIVNVVSLRWVPLLSWYSLLCCPSPRQSPPPTRWSVSKTHCSDACRGRRHTRCPLLSCTNPAGPSRPLRLSSTPSPRCPPG